MLERVRNSGETWLVFFWCALPLGGHLTAPFYILSSPFCRNTDGRFRPVLVWFSALCLFYAGYIFAVSVAADDFASALEPGGDAMSLALCVLIATWVLREGRRIEIETIYKATCLVLILTFCLVAGADAFFDARRPALLMKNPLNLSPLLLVPAVFCTMLDHAPSRVWQLLGLLGFLSAVLVLFVFLQARGSLLVLALLILLRGCWVLLSERSAAPRVVYAGLFLGVPVLIGLFCFFNQDLLARYLVQAERSVILEFQSADATDGEPKAIERLDVTSDHSVNERLAMLQAGWQAFLEKPLFGHGGQNRFSAAAEYLPEGFSKYSHLHNDFLTHAVAGGLPAVLLLMLILGFPLGVALWSPERSGAKFQIALMFTVAFTGTAMVNNVLFVDISAFSLGLSYVMALLLIEAV